MGQNRKEWKGKSHVGLEQFESELETDSYEEKRIMRAEILLVFLIFLLSIVRELFFPSHLRWVIELKELATDLFS